MLNILIARGTEIASLNCRLFGRLRLCWCW